MNKFYVYEWYNIQTQEVFYVGKGSGKRFQDRVHRNKKFLEYIENNKVNSKIVKYFSSEQEAFDYEKELTEQYKKQGMCQCNLMDGGYGGYSSVWSEEMKQYWSENNPMKSEEQRQRMKEHNPMHDKEIALKNGESHKRAVVINNIEYAGIVDAARTLGVWENTVLRWCQRGYDTNGNPCRYKDEKQKDYTIHKTCSKAVIVDGIEYPSLRAAADAIGAKDTSPLCRALKANRPYKGYICKYANQQPS